MKCALPPIHPGEMIAELLDINDLKVAPTAQTLGISRQQLYKVISGKAPVTPSLAARIGKFFGDGPRIWLNMQARYDSMTAEKIYAKDLAKIPTMRPSRRSPKTARGSVPVPHSRAKTASIRGHASP